MFVCTAANDLQYFYSFFLLLTFVVPLWTWSLSFFFRANSNAVLCDLASEKAHRFISPLSFLFAFLLGGEVKTFEADLQTDEAQTTRFRLHRYTYDANTRPRGTTAGTPTYPR